MVYSEIIKIIEGALEKNKEKVIEYSLLLIHNLEKQGENKLADRIRKTLEKKDINPVFLDELSSLPYDNESKLNMVDVEFPDTEGIDLILPKYSENKIVDFIESLKYRKEFNNLGLEIKSSLLLYGPPGCGKTTAAKYISQKTKLPLITARLDTMISSLLGSTSKNIRRIFDFTKSKPCILFLDEFDAIAKARDDQHELGELKRVVNSLLQNVDEFTKENILIAATNHQSLLDNAIWRRFNSIIEIPIPDEESNYRLILSFVKGINNDFTNDEKKISSFSKLLLNRSAADIKNIIQNAISKMIICDEKILSYERLILETYLFINHASPSQENMVKYLNENGVSQKSIAEMMSVSIRQIRNYLNNN